MKIELSRKNRPKKGVTGTFLYKRNRKSCFGDNVYRVIVDNHNDIQEIVGEGVGVFTMKRELKEYPNSLWSEPIEFVIE